MHFTEKIGNSQLPDCSTDCSIRVLIFFCDLEFRICSTHILYSNALYSMLLLHCDTHYSHFFFRTKSQQDFYTQFDDSGIELMSASVATHYWEM